jgi:hypothetical protein
LTRVIGWLLLAVGLALTVWRLAGLTAHPEADHRSAQQQRSVRPARSVSDAVATPRPVSDSVAAAQTIQPIVPGPAELGPTLSLAGLPSLPATAIDGILAAYGSPLRGHGDDLVALSEKYRIDDAVAVAFFVMESRAGTQGEAVLTHSFGNLRPMPNQPMLDGYRYYKTWLDGAKEWFQVMRTLYLDQMKLQNIEDIIPVYAPSVDSNDPASMTYGIRQLVSCWRGALDACPDDPASVPGLVASYRRSLVVRPIQGPALARPHP